MQVTLLSDGVHQIAGVQLRVGAGELDAPVVHHPRHHDGRSQQPREISHPLPDDGRVGDARIEVAERLSAVRGAPEKLGFLARIQAKHHAHQHQAEDGSDDAERVGDRVADLRQPALSGREARHVAQRLLHGRQRRRVGDGARHQPHRAGGVDVQPAMDGHDAEHVHRHQRQRQQVPAQALGAQRRQEPGADLDADAVDEQHQAQLAHELEHLAPALLEGGERGRRAGELATAPQAREHIMAPQQLRDSESGEQDAGDTEREALQLDSAQRQAGRGGQGRGSVMTPATLVPVTSCSTKTSPPPRSRQHHRSRASSPGSTVTGRTPQMSSAYWRMVASLESGWRRRC